MTGWIAALAGVMALSLVPSDVASAQDEATHWLDVAETEDLVRAVYYEGLPLEEARRIGPEGCERLLELLADPSERERHGQIMLAIGVCGPPGGFEALRDWADVPREGEIDRATFRAWQLLPHALGHLAAHDERALARLEQRLNAATAPAWTFRHHRGARLVRQARRAAASCLAETGLEQAGAALTRAERRASDPGFRAHLRESRDRHRAAKRRRADARAAASRSGREGAR